MSGSEVADKLVAMRRQMAEAGIAAVRLRGSDWFSWATAGGSNVVLLSAETGVAEVLVTPEEAWVLTDEIEVARLEAEEVPTGLTLWAGPWAEPGRREAFVAEHLGASASVASDRPVGDEVALPSDLVDQRWSLHPDELERYRSLGRDAAASVGGVLRQARPGWSGHALAGAASHALWKRGIHPTLTLVGDERRLPLYRHPTAAAEPLGRRAMLVVCARRHGLYANLTRFVYFGEPSNLERELHMATVTVEAAALSASTPGTSLGKVFEAMVSAYADAGFPGAERDHHQGGPCGYLARDAVARADSVELIQERNALAWNPSLPGAKSEDTVVTAAAGVEVLTVDPDWPMMEGPAGPRPDLLVMT